MFADAAVYGVALFAVGHSTRMKLRAAHLYSWFRVLQVLGALSEVASRRSANDVIANLGVILAGFLVAWTGSRYPDLVIGLIIGVIVLNGVRRISHLKS